MSKITVHPIQPLLGDAKAIDVYSERPHANPGIGVGLRPIATTQLRVGAVEVVRHLYMHKDLVIHLEFSPSGASVAQVVIKKYTPRLESLKLQLANTLEQDIQHVTVIHDSVMQKLSDSDLSLEKMDSPYQR